MTPDDFTESSLLVLPDGHILARNVTPRLAGLLLALQPHNPELASRAATTHTGNSRPKAKETTESSESEYTVNSDRLHGKCMQGSHLQ